MVVIGKQKTNRYMIIRNRKCKKDMLGKMVCSSTSASEVTPPRADSLFVRFVQEET